MSTDNALSAAAQLYANAYASHYAEHDLLAALRSYEEVVTCHPRSREAEYSRTQILNIVTLVVPAEEFLSAQMALVRRHLPAERANRMAPSSP